MSPITVPITDRAVAVDHLLNARHELLAVQQSTLSATTLWWSCEGAIRNIDRACRELSEIAA